MHSDCTRGTPQSPVRSSVHIDGRSRAKKRCLVRYLEPLTSFRNRVAHHDPIFNRHPKEMYEGLLTVASLLSEDLAQWIQHHARIRSVLSDGPITTGIKF